MSTRYVYSVYNTTVDSNKAVTEVSVTLSDEYPRINIYWCNTYTASVAQNRSGKPVTRYVSTGDIDDGYGFTHSMSAALREQFVLDTSKYKYVILESTVGVEADIIGECYLLEFAPSASGAFWHVDFGKTEYDTISIWNNNSSTPSSKNELKSFYKSGGVIAQGSTILRTESSAKNSLTTGAFEESGVWKWRTDGGSDTIDPSGVAYSKEELYAGDLVEIRVTPRAPTYGGTVYYLYQYSTNGSTWTNIGSRTTNTTASVTIPAGATQFQARVLASDGWGFTSATYVTGPSLGVSQLKAYVGVSGKARAVQKIYIGVNGKAREVVKGYVGVGGKARKFL